MSKNHLYVLWTTDNIVTAEKMVFMYATNSLIHNWWDKATLIIWGATAKLAAENKNIQEKIKEAQSAGVQIRACKACAEQLGVSKILEDLGIEVKYLGEFLTELLKNNEKLITI